MAGTPTNWQPDANEAGLRASDNLRFRWSLYSGAGSLTEVNLAVYSDAGGTALVWDSLLVAPQGGFCGDGWMEVPAPVLTLLDSTDYWWEVRVRDSVPSTSAWSTLTKFTTAAAKVTSTVWGQAQ